MIDEIVTAENVRLGHTWLKRKLREELRRPETASKLIAAVAVSVGCHKFDVDALKCCREEQEECFCQTAAECVLIGVSK